MSERSEFVIDQVFCLLDRWRNLPDYQLERRADIFFALFLPEVLKGRFQLDGKPDLVPEFPIKNCKNNQSSKVDYLAYSERSKRVFLVELKTDMESISVKQIEKMIGTARRGAEKAIEGLKCIAKSTSVMNNRITRGKYHHLLNHLKDISLIEIPNFGRLENMHKRGRIEKEAYENCIGEIECKVKCNFKVVYVLPVDPACIDRKKFKKISRLMRGNDVTLVCFRDFLRRAQPEEVTGRRFTESLCRWTRPAGEVLP